MRKMMLCIILSWLLVMDQAAFAQQDSTPPAGSSANEELQFRYDANAKLFHWLRVGGKPVIPGGVPTRQAFARFVASDEFAKAMDALGITDLVPEARSAVEADHYSEAQLAPNTSESLFLKMAFDGSRVLGPVIWSGQAPLDVWILDLSGIQLKIPKGCGNIGLTAGFQTRTVTVERRVEVAVPQIVEKKVEVLISPCKQEYWKNKTQGTIGAYDFKEKGAKPVKIAELLEGRWDHSKNMNHGNFEFWTPLASETKNGTSIRNAALALMHLQFQDKLDKRVNHLVLTYDWCTDKLYIDAYAEGWHWKEFVLGFIAGFAVGYWVHFSPGPSKVFLNPGNGSRGRGIISVVVSH